MAEKTFEEYFESLLKDESKAGIYLFYDLLAQIGGELIDYRLRNGLTQEDIAKKLGISQVRVSKIENGEWNPSLKTLAMYISKLGGKVKLDLGLAPLPKEEPEEKFINRSRFLGKKRGYIMLESYENEQTGVYKYADKAI